MHIFYLCLLNGFTDGDLEGNFMYISDHGNSVLDYFAVSNCLLQAFQKLVVEGGVESGHMPVETYLNCATSRVKLKQDY